MKRMIKFNLPVGFSDELLIRYSKNIDIGLYQANVVLVYKTVDSDLNSICAIPITNLVEITDDGISKKEVLAFKAVLDSGLMSISNLYAIDTILWFEIKIVYVGEKNNSKPNVILTKEVKLDINKLIPVNKNPMTIGGTPPSNINSIIGIQVENIRYLEVNGCEYLLSIDIHDKTNNIEVYQLIDSSLVFIAKLIETWDGNICTRVLNNIIYQYENNKLLSLEHSINLKPVDIYQVKDIKEFNNKLGSLDLETFQIGDKSYAYSAGFAYNNIDEDKVMSKIYYIDLNNITSENISDKSRDILLNMLKDLMLLDNYVLYVHNLSRFDSTYLISALLSQNDIKHNSVFKDTDIIKITLTKKIDGKIHKILLVDSYLMFNKSLNRLTGGKTLFPYNFVNINTLDYIGPQPDITFYKGVDMGLYSQLLKAKPDFNMREDLLLYLNNDLLILYNFIITNNKKVYSQFGLDPSKVTTMSSLSINIFYSTYNDNFKEIPHIHNTLMYLFLKEALYGGINEVYKPKGKNLYGYDVNSLYPAIAVNNDFPGINAKFIKSFTHEGLLLESLFGVFKATVTAPNKQYYGLLPIRTEKGELMFPLGCYSGLWFSEELKMAVKHGYKVVVHEGYEFNKIKSPFTDYINLLYNKKITATDPLNRNIYKSLLNNLLGRFSIKLKATTTSILSEQKFLDKIKFNSVSSFQPIQDHVIATINNNIDLDRVEILGIPKHQILNDNTPMYSNVPPYASVITTLVINSYARIFMQEMKLLLEKEGIKVYYTDTDSLYTDKQIPDQFVSPTELGKFKLEHLIKDAIFISNKLYYIEDKDNTIKVAAKGINTPIAKKDFLDLYKGEIVKVQIMKSFKQLLYVTFNPQFSINLSPSAYNKRIKLYRNKKWVDTRPYLVK